MISAGEIAGTPAFDIELKRLHRDVASALFAACQRAPDPQETGMTKIFHWRPAQPPQRKRLLGHWARLEPIAPRDHAASLFAATHGPGHDPRLWDFMFIGPFASQQDFAQWLGACAQSEDPLFFAIVDRERGALGLASYVRINPGHGVIEIGNIFFAASLQRTRAATEAIFLLLHHAFDRLGYRRVEWKCDARNRRSRRAARRFGFRFEGLFRQHMVVKGESRDTAWFAITDRDWPQIRLAFERWLKPGNFDRTGKQRTPLTARWPGYSRRAPRPRH